MDFAGKLIAIGFWNGPRTDPGWPSPADFVDPSWDAEERELTATYLSNGLIVRLYGAFALSLLWWRKWKR